MCGPEWCSRDFGANWCLMIFFLPKFRFPRVKPHRLGTVSQVVRFHAETRGGVWFHAETTLQPQHGGKKFETLGQWRTCQKCIWCVLNTTLHHQKRPDMDQKACHYTENNVNGSQNHLTTIYYDQMRPAMDRNACHYIAKHLNGPKIT